MSNPSTAALPAPVPHGLADQLARIAHFRALDLPEVEELDAVACFLLGDVGDAVERLSLWDELRDDCEQLWHLITADWSDDDLDDLRDDDPAWWPFTDAQVLECRYQQTRDRLEGDIETAVRRHRYAVVEARRAARTPVHQLLRGGVL